MLQTLHLTIALKEILGHRDLQNTLRYAHLSPGHIQTAIEKGSLALLGIGTGSKTGSDLECAQGEKMQPVDTRLEFGAPDRNRTCNLLIRSQVLYPIELRAHALFINDLGESVKVAEWPSVK